MAQYQLSSKESCILDIIKVFGEDNMATLIGHTDKDTSGTFEDLNAAIQAGERSNITYCSITPKQQAIWTAFVAKEAASTYRFHEAAYEAAAELVMDTWIEHPRPGTEQPPQRKCLRICMHTPSTQSLRTHTLHHSHNSINHVPSGTGTENVITNVHLRTSLAVV